MSSWAKQQAGGQGRVASLLGKIPGYSGYRNKESRRDEDKQLREELARQYNQSAQRLTDLQGELVRNRKLMEIGNVERLERALRLFTDRLRTATYGYGGLFSDRPVEEAALDQLQAFDRALGDGLDEVRGGVEALENGVRDGNDLAGPLRQLQTAIDTLNRRFDLRSQVLESGQPQAQASVADLFKAPTSEQAHVASDLHFGDAVTIAATDYLVQGRAEFHDGPAAWRQYLLRDGQEERWLYVPPTTQEPMALLRASDEAPAEGEQVMVGGATYRQVASGTATGAVAGQAGQQSGRAVKYRRYSGDNSLLLVYDWGNERQVLTGRSLDPLEVNVYSKP